MAGWLSVDPMSDKYQSISPYAYCVWNPVRLVDPDGKDIKIVLEPCTNCDFYLEKMEIPLNSLVEVRIEWVIHWMWFFKDGQSTNYFRE